MGGAALSNRTSKFTEFHLRESNTSTRAIRPDLVDSGMSVDRVV